MVPKSYLILRNARRARLEGRTASIQPLRSSSHLLRAVARRDAFLLGIGEGGFLVHIGQHLAVGLDPVGDEFPVLAVPLLNADLAVALVVLAGQMDRHHQPVVMQCLDAFWRDVGLLVATL